MAHWHEQFRYETIPVCSTFDRLRAAAASGRFAFPRCVYLAALPDPPGQCPTPDAATDRPQPRWRSLVGPPCHPHLPQGRHGLLARKVFPTDDRQTPAGHRACRAAQGPVAPIAPHPGQAHQPVEPAPGRHRLFRTRLDAAPAQRRGYPPGPEAVRHPLEAGQTLDYQPRPRLRAKKKRATD